MTWASHPAWVCGLKHSHGVQREIPLLVTPCVGVWIETTMTAQFKGQGKVTPCVGVWIETVPAVYAARFA